MSKSRVIFCRRDGSMLAEMDCYTTRSWAFNEYGQAKIVVPKSDPKVAESILNFGNRVVIINDTIEPWGGIIYPPRSWNKESITMSAFSGEFLLKLRGSPATRLSERRNGYLYGGLGYPSVGECITTELAYAQSVESLGIEPGDIDFSFGNGAGSSDMMSYYDAVQQLSDKHKFDWSITPEITASNRLVFKFNLYKARGVRRTDFYLEEGHNIKDDTTFEEQGPLFNKLSLWVHINYPGTTPASWDDVVTATNSKSVTKYGLMELEESSGDTITFGAAYPIDQKLAQVAFGRTTFQASALNINNAFGQLEIGDIVNIRLFSMGFRKDGGLGTESRVRILGKSYSDMDGDVMDLVLDSVEELLHG